MPPPPLDKWRTLVWVRSSRSVTYVADVLWPDAAIAAAFATTIAPRLAPTAAHCPKCSFSAISSAPAKSNLAP
jgi:hypothetical protein